jgi:hypothetical protein
LVRKSCSGIASTEFDRGIVKPIDENNDHVLHGRGMTAVRTFISMVPQTKSISEAIQRSP